MRKLKIIHISDSDFWGMGENKGVTCIFLPIKECIKRGHEVHYILSTEDYREKAICQKNYEGINMYWFNIPIYPSKIKVKFLRILLVKLYTLVFAIKGTIVAYRIAKRVKPDIVVGGQPRGVIVAYFIGKIFKIPNISRFYGTFLYKLLVNPLEYIYMFDEVIAWKLPATFYIITNDGSAGNKVARKLGIPFDKIVFWRDSVEEMLIPNFPKAEFKQKSGIPVNSKVVLSVSRLARWKRVDRTIRSIPAVVEKQKDVIFLIVGDGSQRLILEQLAKELNVEPYVRFTGALERRDIRLVLNMADIFVSCYEISNASNSLLEAMMARKCIVTLDNGETSSLIKNGENGFLIEDRDYIIQRELPKKLLELLDDEKLRDKIGKTAFWFAKENFIALEKRIAMEVDLLEKIAK